MTSTELATITLTLTHTSAGWAVTAEHDTDQHHPVEEWAKTLTLPLGATDNEVFRTVYEGFTGFVQEQYPGARPCFRYSIGTVGKQLEMVCSIMKDNAKGTVEEGVVNELTLWLNTGARALKVVNARGPFTGEHEYEALEDAVREYRPLAAANVFGPVRHRVIEDVKNMVRSILDDYQFTSEAVEHRDNGREIVLSFTFVHEDDV